MNPKYLHNIELDKIQHMAAERAVCTETKQRILEEIPYTRAADVRELLAQTDTLASHLLKNGNPRLSSCDGALEAVRRAIKGGVLSMAELLYVAGALRNFSGLTGWFSVGESDATSMDDLFYTITPQPALERDIFDKIISDTEMADTASDELYSLRKKIRGAEASIRDRLDGIIKNPNLSKYLRESIVSLRNGRYVVPVKAENRGDIGGVIHDVSSSGGTLFVEPTAVVEANAKILQLRNQEQQEIEHILQQLSLRVLEFGPMFEASYDAMLEIDKRIAKAELGLTMRGVRPEVSEGQAFNLVKARHPLLNRDTAVPIDVALGDGYDTMIITGPNTGGKTVTLKTAGLLSAMAQLGYLIPAHDTSSVCVFEQILVDIGDEQSIEQSLSTFSGHIRNISGILELAGPRSLVLMDELGAGTDPAEGAALAVAIIERLRETSARIMATTHYAELKLYALDTEGVQNAGSEFNVETLRPTYRLVMGVPGRSNAFLIGEKLGLPATILQSARQHLSSEQRRFETVLAQLEDVKLELKAQEEEIERLRYTATHQLEEARQKRDALIAQGQQELEAARRKAKDLADDVQNQAYALMDEMKRLEKDARRSNAQKAQRAREIARQDSTGLQKKSAHGAPVKQRTFTPLQAVKIGQEVYLPEMEKNATVLALPDKAGMVEVRMGSLKTKLPLKELAAAEKPQKQPSHRKGGVTTTRNTGVGERTPKTELNLLGKTVDEALMETDTFIDNAVMSGLNTLYIIHGRGTGALRAAINQHLRRSKQIKSFRLGTYGEGEDGVTVVELK